MEENHFADLRHQMVQVIALYVRHAGQQIGKAILDDRVMQIMDEVPRHDFVPAELRPYAYVDGPLPIGFEKTISQPFMIALMTDLLNVREEHTVLEIGTGLGYHAAILAELARKVFTVEIIEELATQAKKNLRRRGYTNIEMRIGDGSKGWPEHAPFDVILVAAAADLIPPALINQIKPGGRMVIPAGNPDAQQLMLVEKDEGSRVTIREILPVRFSLLESYT